jgi:hypothetical protein
MKLTLPLTIEQIQQSRTPTELSAWIAEVRCALKNNPNELRAAQKMEGFYKVFLEELTPLSEFCAHRFNDGFLVTPVVGNQAYDAKVSSRDGTESHQVEITMPRNGALEASEQRLAERRGYGTVHFYKPGEEVQFQRKFAIETSEKKSTKDYSECLLVFALPTSLAFPELRHQHVAEEDKTIASIAEQRYLAKEVWVICAERRIVRVHV